MVLDVRDIPHRIAYFEIDFIGTIKDVIKYFLYFLVYLFAAMSYLSKEVTVLLGLKTALAPRLSVEQVFIDISLYEGVLNLRQLTMTVTTYDIAAHTVANAEFLPNLFCCCCRDLHRRISQPFVVGITQQQ